MPERLRNLLAAAIVGALFIVGLVIHGALGGVLLLVTALVLAVMTSAIWHHIPSRGKPLRILIVLVVIAVALIKFALG